jgi:hypothetical protein
MNDKFDPPPPLYLPKLSGETLSHTWSDLKRWWKTTRSEEGR